MNTLPVGINLRRVDEVIQNSQEYLLSLQTPDGYWVGELEADVSVSAGYIPLMYFMLGEVDPERLHKVINFVKSKQKTDGSWSTYPGGTGNLNVSIQAYFALKLGGISSQEPFMQRARDFILTAGGINQANVFTKIWLAHFGQFGWRGVPTIPPEIIYLPNWFYVNIYEFSSWSRATIMALIISITRKSVCSIPESAQVSELYLGQEGKNGDRLGRGKNLLSWQGIFLLLDALFKVWERLPVQPGRRSALRRVEQWVVDHQETDGSWGGIMLPWIFSLMALKSHGYPLDHPVIARGLAGLENFIVEDDATLRLQPAVSPVWDTAWAIIALRESGLPADHAALKKAAHWLLDQEIRSAGDWQVKNPNTEPGGWAFEFENQMYPDLDDSAVVSRALRRVQLSDEMEETKAQALGRAHRWIMDMQSKDGGWAAFDRDNNKMILAQVPYVDFMSPLDPTCPDVTAHVVELLGELETQHTDLQRALDYLKSTQGSDGAWYGRWGVNYIYGTSLALSGLISAGVSPEKAFIQRAVDWLVACQNTDGGWGETCRSYAEPEKRGCGLSTASQTAWALAGLMAAGEVSSQAVRDGIQYLVRTQGVDGIWREEDYSGTGFPRLFYLRYEYYSLYFPLIALARYKDNMEEYSQ